MTDVILPNASRRSIGCQDEIPIRDVSVPGSRLPRKCRSFPSLLGNTIDGSTLHTRADTAIVNNTDTIKGI